MNKIIIMGRFTADPELKNTQSGITSCRFNIAVNRRFADKQTGQYIADFIPCIAWGKTAEFINKYFKKGSMAAIEGRLQTGSYQDKNHPDVMHYTVDLVVENVDFCGSKSENAATFEETETNSVNLSDYENVLVDNEDVPF